MALATLFGKLQEHELELNRLNQYEEIDKRKKGIALKATSSMHEGSDEDENDSLESVEANDENFSFLVKKFGRFFRKKGNQRKTPFAPKKNLWLYEDGVSNLFKENREIWE